MISNERPKASSLIKLLIYSTIAITIFFVAGVEAVGYLFGPSAEGRIASLGYGIAVAASIAILISPYITLFGVALGTFVLIAGKFADRKLSLAVLIGLLFSVTLLATIHTRS